MSKQFYLILVLFCWMTLTLCDEEKPPTFGSEREDWGFVDVREGAHMFWWLYYTTANVTKYTDKPLFIWLQGGPGAGSSGYGNFMEVGPLDSDLKERSFSWDKQFNVLFVDNPVGAGYSYVDNKKYLTTNNSEIANDLIALLEGFYKKHPEFKNVELHIQAESYGGKMAIEFAYELAKRNSSNKEKIDIKSVTLIDSWISPIDSMESWAPFLYGLGFIDTEGYQVLKQYVRRTSNAIKFGNWEQATAYWTQTESLIYRIAYGVDFYNVLQEIEVDNIDSLLKNYSKNKCNELGRIANDEDQRLKELMRGPVATALGIPSKVVWASQGDITFQLLRGDFMKPVIKLVERVLNETSIHVNVVTGQLDLIVATQGTVAWVDKMKWDHGSFYKLKSRKPIYYNHVLEGFYKTHNNFSFYWVNRAGHMVPRDNHKGMNFILNRILNDV